MNPKTRSIFLAPIAVTIILMALLSPQTQAQGKSKMIKIGVYDSRVIVLVYSRSEMFGAYMKNLGQKSDSALQAKDTTKFRELAIHAMSYQHLLHQMVFGAGSAAAIIGLVKDKLPEVTSQAGVSIIVSKFELTYKDPSVEIVDVTDKIIPLFNPKGDNEKIIAEIGKAEPIPLADLSIEEDMLNGFCQRFGKK
jgi:hypothetical protein